MFSAPGGEELPSGVSSSPQRDELWLQQLLDDTWDRYFPEVPQDNIVRIVFGKRAKRQLGSIRLDRRDTTVSVITINGLFRDPMIPEFIVIATLVHELIHYAHGFNSPLARKHAHPHAGGVIRAEYAERCLEALYVRQKRWLKANWQGVVAANFASAPRRRPSSRKNLSKVIVRKPFWL
jgi:hypothetical protein